MAQTVTHDENMDRVHALDDDASSIGSPVSPYIAPAHPVSHPPPPPEPLPPSQWQQGRPKIKPLRVDGKVPKVLHVIEYIGRNQCCVEARQSESPFDRIPPWNEVLDAHDKPLPVDDKDEDAKNKEDKPEDKPVIEIVTTVFSRPHQRQVVHRGAQGPPNNYRVRPITAAFYHHGYGEEDHYSYEQVFDPVAKFAVREPSMYIRSQHLMNALRAVVVYYPYFRLDGKVISLLSPYRELYHHREELARYRDDQPASHDPDYAATTADHIDTLLKFLDENGSPIREEEERHHLPTPMATFEYFWLLLKPGNVVYAKRYDIWTPFVVSAVWGGPSSLASSTSDYTIDCWTLESNGAKVHRFMFSFQVAPWLGEQAISSLPVVPASFWAEDLAAQGGLIMRERQIQLGRTYWELLKRPTYMEYDGMLVDSGGATRQASGPTGFMSGRVICDVSGFDKYFDRDDFPFVRDRVARNFVSGPPPMDHLPKSLPRCCCAACLDNKVNPDSAATAQSNDTEYARFGDLDPNVDEPPVSELFYLVLGNTLPGFILGSRRWGHLNVANLRPVVADHDAFHYLVLNDEIKMTVRALVSKFSHSALDGIAAVSPWGQDIVRNKGEGRIFLMHGHPGVGKTATVEAIAELTNRPLISLTSGDLDTEPYRVERLLSYFLELGQRYGALVLLDEADVYLERRRSKDIERNGLVSIFLRALEYYKGVLFLTTNRVQSFDGAFLSRIHVALHYKNLSDEDRERIWTNNFDRLDRELVSTAGLASDGGNGGTSSVHVSVAACDYVRNSHEIRSLRWNGREIRNAMQTALALAESDAHDAGLDAVVIGEKHIRAVAKLSKGFRDYIKTFSTAFQAPRTLGNTFEDEENYDRYEDRVYYSDTNENVLF